jgi:hypothetical protein
LHQQHEIEHLAGTRLDKVDVAVDPVIHAAGVE